MAGNLKKYKCEKNGKEYAGIRMVRNTNLKMILYPCSHTELFAENAMMCTCMVAASENHTLLGTRLMH